MRARACACVCVCVCLCVCVCVCVLIGTRLGGTQVLERMCRDGFVATDYESVMTAYILLDDNGVRGKEGMVRTRAASTMAAGERRGRCAGGKCGGRVSDVRAPLTDGSGGGEMPMVVDPAAITGLATRLQVCVCVCVSVSVCVCVLLCVRVHVVCAAFLVLFHGVCVCVCVRARVFVCVSTQEYVLRAIKGATKELLVDIIVATEAPEVRARQPSHSHAGAKGAASRGAAAGGGGAAGTATAAAAVAAPDAGLAATDTSAPAPRGHFDESDADEALSEEDEETDEQARAVNVAAQRAHALHKLSFKELAARLGANMFPPTVQVRGTRRRRRARAGVLLHCGCHLCACVPRVRVCGVPRAGTRAGGASSPSAVAGDVRAPDGADARRVPGAPVAPVAV